MFDDLEEEGVEVNPESPDRAIAWAIWSRTEESALTPDEAWAILHERYPDEPRFLLLNAYTELSETRRHSERVIKAAAVAGSTLARQGQGAKTAEVGGWTPGYFLKKVERIVAGAAEPLHPHVRDLVTFGALVLAAAKDEDLITLAQIRTTVGVEDGEPKRDDRDRAGLRLRRFEREVLKELSDRTEGNQPLGVRAAPAGTPAHGSSGAPGLSDWASAVADASKTKKRYAPDARFERGELVEHPKFGIGVVTGTEPGKAVILFESGVRKLVAGTG
jgi:hypothetical protein